MHTCESLIDHPSSTTTTTTTTTTSTTTSTTNNNKHINDITNDQYAVISPYVLDFDADDTTTIIDIDSDNRQTQTQTTKLDIDHDSRQPTDNNDDNGDNDDSRRNMRIGSQRGAKADSPPAVKALGSPVPGTTVGRSWRPTPRGGVGFVHAHNAPETEIGDRRAQLRPNKAPAGEGSSEPPTAPGGLYRAPHVKPARPLAEFTPANPSATVGLRVSEPALEPSLVPPPCHAQAESYREFSRNSEERRIEDLGTRRFRREIRSSFWPMGAN